MLQYLNRITDKQAHMLTKETFDRLLSDNWVEENVRLARMALQEGNKESYRKAKSLLPSVMWVGYDASGKMSRRASDLTPTQLYMVDIDHCRKDVCEWVSEFEDFGSMCREMGIVFAHITPSGTGLRLVARATESYESVIEHMDWLVSELNLEELGDYDRQCRDLSRQSFLVPSDDVLYYDEKLFDESENRPIKCAYGTVGYSGAAEHGADGEPCKESRGDKQGEPCAECAEGSGSAGGECASVDACGEDDADTDVGALSVGGSGGKREDRASDKSEFERFEYRGTAVREIAGRYVEVYGEPGDGERHGYYNQMVKNFRCICDNNPRIVHAVLPRFGHSYEETLSQCESICRTNTLSRLPRDFYFFLKDNGYYKPRRTASESEYEEYMTNTDATNEDVKRMPPLPPVLREIVGTMPDDYKIPAINGLMPILGTLTSHLRAVYPLDLRVHSTNFFSIVYAPPSTNKSFLERHMSMLHEDLLLRDMLSNERENLYNKIISKKGSNEKSPDNPHVTLRIVEPKQSETDFLEKQQANNGKHMFTYAAEMDSWRKGVKAAGGNKDDMIRIAWDNGSYGQNFKSANSFKGRVNLYWNVFICGTEDQLAQYFKNVENGLVTRCCFTSIKNQEFQDAPQFKKLSKSGEKLIREFMSRMDGANYKEPLNFDPEMLRSISDEDFDKEVPWRYEFKGPVEVEMKWVMPTIMKFLRAQLQQASLDQDHARDVFRRRTAVRGFRMALLCTALYKKMDKKAEKEICKFIEWWMPIDLEGIMDMFADKYNEIADKGSVKLSQKGVFELLDNEFDKSDVFAACKRLGKKTPVKVIIYNWKKIKAIKELEDGKYMKIKVSSKL